MIKSMLSANAGSRRVAIGCEPLASLRSLSNERKLSCAACGAPVVLRAGPILAAHFAHMGGGLCAPTGGEPETAEHRAGKSILAEWLAKVLDSAAITLEAPIAATGQRADILAELPGDAPIAIEFQCADLSAREWRRRNALYQSAGIRSLWILGASRLAFGRGLLTCGEVESALLVSRAPLLYLETDSEPDALLIRFRPASGARARMLMGRLSRRPLSTLPFPWRLLAREELAARTDDGAPRSGSSLQPGYDPQVVEGNDSRLRAWLEYRYRAPEASLPRFFGAEIRRQRVFACSPRLWQACLYYRFIHGRVGEAWWLDRVETWVRRYLPLASAEPLALRRALREYEAILAAAGFLSVSTIRGSGRVEADLPGLGRDPDPAAARRLAAYRRTLLWDRG